MNIDATNELLELVSDSVISNSFDLENDEFISFTLNFGEDEKFIEKLTEKAESIPSGSELAVYSKCNFESETLTYKIYHKVLRDDLETI